MLIKLIPIVLLLRMNVLAQVKYEIPAKKSVLEKSLEIGLEEIGTIEKSNRNNGEVVKYLAPFSLKEGNPYCAAGQYYIFLKAIESLHLEKKYIPIPKTALANEIFNYAKKGNKKVRYFPAKHNLLVWRKAKTKFGHIERIIEVEGKGWVKTLAFNVTCGDGKEGVCRKRRNVLHPLGRLAIRGLIGFAEYE
ncbi:MAG: hypothetical protein A2X64_02860 [Ignavibacteria bacterium GWF2_33_9]|nr:MAG: hypothetical protein A2X64_02860 [Ignavibacteria bacterium GWF2_33_9]